VLVTVAPSRFSLVNTRLSIEISRTVYI